MHDDIRLKRIHDPPEDGDGSRVLVDRVWPRGVRKADARIDRWLREVAPSTELRKWFGHEPDRWPAFRERYRGELAEAPQALRELLALCRQDTVTLVFSARDRERNQAVVLKEVLQEELAAESQPNEPASPVCYGEQVPGPGERKS